MGYKNGDCCVIRHRHFSCDFGGDAEKVQPGILDSYQSGRWGISGEYGVILLKTLGVCFLTQLSADSCRDAGEGALAAKVELAGKLFIVILALPLFQQIAGSALSLIGGGA